MMYDGPLFSQFCTLPRNLTTLGLDNTVVNFVTHFCCHDDGPILSLRRNNCDTVEDKSIDDINNESILFF
jgi:hypothetical protein